MKIAHINMIFSKGRMSGVEKKLIDEAAAMVKNGIEVYLLNREKDGFENNIHYINMDNFLLTKTFPELFLRSFRYNIIDHFINLSKYDYIILRYLLLDFSAFGFAKKYKDKLITEHHTKELQEIKVLNVPEPFKSVQYYLEKYGARFFFKYIYGVIGISSDVVETLKSRIDNPQIKSFVFSNGIALNNQPNRTIPEVNTNFNILFVASVFNNWHGLDRLLQSAQIYTGKYSLVLHLVGKIDTKYDSMIKDCQTTHCNIIQYGTLNQMELQKIYPKIHVACDSLAMFRIGMTESSTLKSKEYILHQLPFIYSAPDPDLVDLKPYLFMSKNDDSLINFEDIIKQYLSLDRKQMSLDFQICLQETLNWDVKVKKLIQWIKNNNNNKETL